MSADSRFLAAGTENKTIGLFDLQRKAHLHSFQDAHQSNKALSFLLLNNFLDKISSVVFTSDSKQIISGSWDKSLKFFDIEKKQEIRQLKNHHKGILQANYLFNVSLRWNQFFNPQFGWKASHLQLL